MNLIDNWKGPHSKIISATPGIDTLLYAGPPYSTRWYPADQRFHAALILGFTDPTALRAFFSSGEIATLSGKLPKFVSAIHAYEVTEALTYVKDGYVLPHCQT